MQTESKGKDGRYGKEHVPRPGPVPGVRRKHGGHQAQVFPLRTELSGEFSPCRFCRLEEKHLQFVETFLRCRGSIKEVERALGVSYPTVKNMLDAALSALGLDEKPELRALREKEERSEILQRLSNGEIGVDTAIEALNQLKGGK